MRGQFSPDFLHKFLSQSDSITFHYQIEVKIVVLQLQITDNAAYQIES